MSGYSAPLRDMQFLISELIGVQRTATARNPDEINEELVDSILSEAGKFASEVIAPLNQTGDRQGCRLENGVVTTPDGFREAYSQFINGGWNGLRCDLEYGGHDLPHLVAIAVEEMATSASLAFALSPALNMGAIEAIHLSASQEQKDRFLHKMVSGEWAGTMNLTEPQAGSDLGSIRTQAVKEADYYRIRGQKIFITYGDHDFTENIIHLVLARTPDAPEGAKGISLFIVPKRMINEDGSCGDLNDIKCVSLEHKLGIHGSPTAMLSFGDNEGAIGYLVGEENRGLEYMFIMMNLSRMNSGMQGPALGERAYQKALNYARERIQGKLERKGPKVPIIEYPDVKRMLMTMRCQIEAMRALVYKNAELLDFSTRVSESEDSKQLLYQAELLTPVIKGWCTEVGQQVTSLGIQIHGGMGFIEETGAAQYMRDSRITTIYEGTTGIQANDLLGRKIGRDKGAALMHLITEMYDTLNCIESIANEDCAKIANKFRSSLTDLSKSSDYIIENYSKPETSAVAVPFLMQLGYTCGAWLLAKSAKISFEKINSDAKDFEFYKNKIQSSVFYSTHVLPVTSSLSDTVISGADIVSDINSESFNY